MKKNIFIQSRTIFITLLMIAFSFNIAYCQSGINFDFAYGSVGNYTNWRGYQAQNTSPDALGSTTITFSSWIPSNTPNEVLLGGAHCFEINSNQNENDEQIGSSLKKYQMDI